MARDFWSLYEAATYSKVEGYTIVTEFGNIPFNALQVLDSITFGFEFWRVCAIFY